MWQPGWEGSLGKKDTDMCVAEIETISYIPIQNEKLKKNVSGVYL